MQRAQLRHPTKKLFQIHPAALFPCAAMPRCRQGDAVRWAAARGRRILTLGEREVVSLLLGSNFLVEPSRWVFQHSVGRKILTMGESFTTR